MRLRSTRRRVVASFEYRPTSAILVALTAVCAPLLLTTVWASSTGAGDARTAGMVGAAAVVSVALVSAGIVMSASVDVPSIRRRSWMLTVVGLVAYAIGAAIWFFTLHGTMTPSTTGPGDAAYLVAMAAFAAATLRHPLMQPQSRLIRSCIDAAIVAASITTVLWFIAGRHLLAETDDRLGTAICLLFPALDVFIIVLCLTATTRPRIDRRSVASGLLLTAAFSSLLVGDIAQAVIRTYGTGAVFPLLVEAAWISCFVLLAAASWVARGHSTSIRLPMPRTQLAATLAAIPVVGAVVATIATVVDATRNGRVDGTATLLLMTVVALALVRQSLTVSDNMRLGASLQDAVDELASQASHDTLTRLPNRSGLLQRITDGIERADRDGRFVALLFLDLDHLKAVNDSLGHHSGDELLRVVSERLTARVGDRVTRFGGDEFVVLLDGLTDPTVAARTGRSIVDDASCPVTVHGYRFRPSVSVGVALVEDGISPEELLRRADAALYHAKSLGRRCVAEYRPGFDIASRRHVDLEPELRRALDRDEFEVHYQPVVQLSSGRVVGVESLLRWRHPARGLLLPSDFLDEAASNGMLTELGRRTLMRVCDDFGKDVDRDVERLSVAVNLSTSELVDERVVDHIAAALRAGGLAPGRLTIEITEDVIVDDTIRRTIDRIRHLGVDLSIDDFGTGNSSLRQLGAYPASTLKIDRSFVEHIEDDPQSATVTRAILRLASNLGLRTVAEGVETEGQARLLSQLGCDLAQGWLYAKAMPRDELVRFVRGRSDRAVDQPARRASVESASEMIEASSSATGGRSSITPTT